MDFEMLNSVEAGSWELQIEQMTKCKSLICKITSFSLAMIS